MYSLLKHVGYSRSYWTFWKSPLKSYDEFHHHNHWKVSVVDFLYCSCEKVTSFLLFTQLPIDAWHCTVLMRSKWEKCVRSSQVLCCVSNPSLTTICLSSTVEILSCKHGYQAASSWLYDPTSISMEIRSYILSFYSTTWSHLLLCATAISLISLSRSVNIDFYYWTCIFGPLYHCLSIKSYNACSQ